MTLKQRIVKECELFYISYKKKKKKSLPEKVVGLSKTEEGRERRKRRQDSWRREDRPRIGDKR